MIRSQLRTDIETALNRNNAEGGSDTPDFILAEYLVTCLEAFDKTLHARSDWYNHHCRIGGCNHWDIKEDAKIEPPIESRVEVVSDSPKSEIITGTCLICGLERDGGDKYWCSACVKKQQNHGIPKDILR